MDISGRHTGTYVFVAQLSPIKGMKEFLGYFLKITFQVLNDLMESFIP